MHPRDENRTVRHCWPGRRWGYTNSGAERLILSGGACTVRRRQSSALDRPTSELILVWLHDDPLLTPLSSHQTSICGDSLIIPDMGLGCSPEIRTQGNHGSALRAAGMSRVRPGPRPDVRHR